MRRIFADELYRHAQEDSSIYLVTADLGYKVWDQWRDTLPLQFLNTGASEQSALDICIGLAMAGKKPYFYSITPFLIFRPFESIRNYINHEKWNVKLIGSGRDNDYKHDGWSHNATDVRKFMDQFENIHQSYPETKEEIPSLVDVLVQSSDPWFISLKK